MNPPGVAYGFETPPGSGPFAVGMVIDVTVQPTKAHRLDRLVFSVHMASCTRVRQVRVQNEDGVTDSWDAGTYMLEPTEMLVALGDEVTVTLEILKPTDRVYFHAHGILPEAAPN
jgi:hypothetical protein